MIKPIFLYHVEKTGGRSLRISFVKHLVEKYKCKTDPFKIHFGSWGEEHFEVGPYIIGGENNNIPWEGTHGLYNKDIWTNYYRIVILRNPIDRIFSFIRMLYAFESKESNSKFYLDYKYLIENGIENFAEMCPNEILNKQTYTFSQTFSLMEAFENIKDLNLVMFTEYFQEGLDQISSDLNLTPKLENIYFKGESEYGPTNDEILNKNNMLLKQLEKKLDLDIKLYQKCLKTFRK